jgi:hypothetical protein
VIRIRVREDRPFSATVDDGGTAAGAKPAESVLAREVRASIEMWLRQR